MTVDIHDVNKLSAQRQTAASRAQAQAERNPELSAAGDGGPAKSFANRPDQRYGKPALPYSEASKA